MVGARAGDLDRATDIADRCELLQHRFDALIAQDGDETVLTKLNAEIRLANRAVVELTANSTPDWSAR